MSNSAICTVNGTTLAVSGTTGANVSSGSTITIKLTNPAGVQAWSILCTSTDEITSAATVNATLVQNNTTWSATFTAPTTNFGAALQFQSITNQGYANQCNFTFGCFIPLDGYRLFFGAETVESNATVGNAADLNALARGVANGGGGGSFTAGGDLSGTSSSQTVSKIQGVVITTSAVSSGKILTATGSTSAVWASPVAPTSISGITISGTPSVGYILTATSSSAANWQVAPSGAFTAGGDLTGSSSSQTVSKIGGVIISGTAAANKVLLASSSSTQTWNFPNNLNGVVVSAVAPTAGQVLSATSGTFSQWTTPASGAFTAGGDLTGTSSSQTVAKIQGNPVSAATPFAAQILIENAAASGSVWTTLTGDGYISPGGGGPTVYSYRGVNIPGFVVGYSGGNYLSGVPVSGSTYIAPATGDMTYVKGKFSGSGASPTVMFSMTLEAMQSANGSAMSTAIITNTINKTSNTYCSNFFAAVDAFLADGFTVIIKAHQLDSGANVAFTYNNIAIGSGGFSNSQFGAVWAQIATLYSSNANVWFSLMNEPQGVGDTQWTTAMQAAINGIRGVNTVGKILVSTPNYDSCVGFFTGNYSGTDTPAVLYLGLTGTNIALEVHNYGDGANGYSGSGVQLDNNSVFVTYLSPINSWAITNNVQVFVGEFAADTGATGGTPSTALGNMYSLINANPSTLIGGTWWTYTPVGFGASLFDLQPTTPYTVDAPDMALYTPFLVYSAGGGGGGTFGEFIVEGIQTIPVSSTAPTTSQVLTYNGTHWAPANASGGFTAGGDLTGTSSSQKVASISVTGATTTFPASQGTAATQSGKIIEYIGYCTVTNNTVTVITIPLATSHTSVSLNCQGVWRVTSATGIGNGGSQMLLTGFKNIGGTVTQYSGTSTANIAGPVGDTTYLSEISVQATVSGTNCILSFSSSTAAVTFDCTLRVSALFS